MEEDITLKTDREIKAYNKGVRETHKYWEDKINDKIEYIKMNYSQMNGDYFMMNYAIEVLQELLEKE